MILADINTHKLLKFLIICNRLTNTPKFIPRHNNLYIRRLYVYVKISNLKANLCIKRLYVYVEISNLGANLVYIWFSRYIKENVKGQEPLKI